MYIECPYCEKEIEIDHEDGYDYEENEKYQQECPECGKTFIYDTFVQIEEKANGDMGYRSSVVWVKI